MKGKQITMIGILIAMVMLSGCIELESYSEPAPNIDSVFTADEISEYLTTHDLSAGFGEMQITLHPDKTVTVGDETGTYVPTGAGGDAWRCAIRGIDGVDYLYLYTGRTAVACNGSEKLSGWWFR